MNSKHNRPEWCSNNAAGEAFEKAQWLWFQAYRREASKQYMTAENTQRYMHGRAFSHPANEDPTPSTLASHSASMTTSLEDVRDHRLDKWADGLLDLSDQMHQAMAGMVYKAIEEVTEKHENVVSRSDVGSNAEAFLEMIRKIEFGVDRNGHPSLPSIHASPEMANKLITELESQPPEFHEELERIKQQKIAEALQREEKRKARFKNYGG